MSFEKLVDAFSSSQARLAAGATAMVAITVGLWPDHPRNVDPAKLAAVITAIVAWLGSEAASARIVSDHDKALFTKIQAQFPEGSLEFLRNHDFNGSFHHGSVANLHLVESWNGARYEFRDKRLQRTWRELHEVVAALSLDLAQFTSPTAHQVFSAHPTMDNPAAPDAHTQANIERLNTSATNLVGLINAFERQARDRLKL